jgi:hypothetical protein
MWYLIASKQWYCSHVHAQACKFGEVLESFTEGQHLFIIVSSTRFWCNDTVAEHEPLVEHEDITLVYNVATAAHILQTALQALWRQICMHPCMQT